MTITQTQTRPWDLTHLVSFLPAQHKRSSTEDDIVATHEAVPSTLKDSDHNSASTPLADGLGDFSKVWRFLGTPSDAPSGSHAILPKDDYASDGAMYPINELPRHQRGIPNRPDDMDGVETVFDLGQTGPKMQPGEPDCRQQKKDRKKAKRGAKKSILAANRATLSESEFDGFLSRETPASKASSHGMTTRSMSAKLQVNHGKSKEPAIKAIPEAAALFRDDSEALPDTPCPNKDLARAANLATPAQTTCTEQDPSAVMFIQQQVSSTTPTGPRQPYATPNIYKTNNLIPSSLQPSLHGKPVRSTQPLTAPQPAKKSVLQPTITPIILRSGEDRALALYMKLIRNFGSDLAHLVKPMSMINHSSDPAGLHCFIDFSNIAIGFVEQLKRSRNIHPMQRIPDVNLSFDSLALLIERRRPVAKRVLVGSSPNIAAFDKARAVGYEVSVLEKVYKARELTERQIYFKEVEARRFGRKSSTRAPFHKIALQGSVLTPGGSETTVPVEPRFAPARFVEQGVDEILHLKMMESILDAETPSTIVLATGDANCGEYSSGFIAMVERALRKGWKVELTSWSRNTSSMYKHQAWTAAWGERFRIIELDDYAEELLEL